MITLLPLVIVVPILAAIAAFVLPRWSYAIALIGSLLTVGLVIGLAISLPEAGAVRHTIGGWRAPLGIDLVLDGLALLMLLLTALIGIAITLYARGYFGKAAPESEKGRQAVYFWALWMFLWAALNALFLSGDVFNLYVTLELLGFSAVALTALAGKPNVLKAAMRYLIISLSGSLMYLMGVAFLYGGFGVLDIAQLNSLTRETPALAVAAALMTAGLAMKTALFPLHFWLPPAHANAAAPVSALLSALVVKGSFYILLRLWLEVLYPLADTFVPQIISLLGVGAILWGSIQAIRQTRLKLLIAYSTVAQLGYLFVLIPILALERENTLVLGGIICFVLAHASAKAAAFLSAGNILQAINDDRLSKINGLMRALPLTVTAFGLAGLSLVALPPSGGFAAKWLMLETAISRGYWGLTLVIVGGGLLAAIYIMRVMGRLFNKDAQPEVLSAFKPIPRVMELSAFGLSVLAIALGFTAVYVLNFLEIGVRTLAGGS